MEHKLINGHEAVDLGLPSGTLWATCNVGASLPEEFGYYFAWGETTPKSIYNWDTYKYGSAYNKLTKYCDDSYYGTEDNRTELELSDDAAAVNWGSDWRMPTMTQLLELSKHCTWTSTTFNYVKGMLVVGPNGNSIFLPAAGYRSGCNLNNMGYKGKYWGALPYYTPYQACRLFFSLFFPECSISWSHDSRYNGFCVRPVLVSSKKRFFQRTGHKCIIKTESVYV